MLCRTTWHPTAAQQCLPLCFLKSTSTFEFGVNCFINIVPLSSHYFNTWILFLFKQDFFFFSSMFSSVQLAHVLKATCLSVTLKYAEEARWMDISRKKWQRLPTVPQGLIFSMPAAAGWSYIRCVSVCLQRRERPTYTYHPAKCILLSVCRVYVCVSCMSSVNSCCNHRIT